MKTSRLMSAEEWAEQTDAAGACGRSTPKPCRWEREQPGSRMTRQAVCPLRAPNTQSEKRQALLLHCPDVTSEQLIPPHLQQTREEAGKMPCVLMIQDTTEVDYQQYQTQG